MRLINWLICAQCLVKKSIDEFGKNKNQPGGKHYYCKSCTRERSKKNRTNNPDYYKSYREEHRQDLINYSKEYRRRNRKKINDDRQKKAAEKNLSEDTK